MRVSRKFDCSSEDALQNARHLARTNQLSGVAAQFFVQFLEAPLNQRKLFLVPDRTAGRCQRLNFDVLIDRFNALLRRTVSISLRVLSIFLFSGSIRPRYQSEAN